jgi:hypothetical protein
VREGQKKEVGKKRGEREKDHRRERKNIWIRHFQKTGPEQLWALNKLFQNRKLQIKA